MSPENVLITGGTGLIGSRLTEMLLEQGHNVAHLSRSSHNGQVKTYTWDLKEMQVDKEAFKDTTVVVHLAGAGIGDKPWTEVRKRELLESRTLSAAMLMNTLRETPNKVKAFVSASGANYYGFDKGPTLFTESDPPGDDFLANVVVQWEREVDRAGEIGIRTVKMRTGFVLSKDGGALKELARPVRLFVGAPLGSGSQRVSWIHIDDLCGMFIQAITDDTMQGAYNAGGPEPITNTNLTKAIAKALHKPLILPNIPAFVLKTLLGEMSELVLNGTSMSSEKIQRAGYNYRFQTIESALHDIYAR